MFCPIIDLKILGPGFPLYFKFIMFCTCLLITFLIAAYPTIKENSNGNNCKTLPDCTDNFYIIRLSIINGIVSTNRKSTLILNLYTILAMMGVVLLFRLYNKSFQIKIDESILSASDFTIMVTGIPKTENDIEIGNFFSKRISGEFKVIFQYLIL